MKNFTNFESNVSGLTRVCLGFVSGLSRFSFGEVAEKCGRYAAMIFAVLVMSIGQVWGATYTWTFDNSANNNDIDLSTRTTALSSYTTSGKSMSYVGGSSCKIPKKTAYLAMGGASTQSSNALSARYFILTAPSANGTISVTFAGTASGNELIRTDNGDYQVIATATSTTKVSSLLSGLTAGTTKIYIAFTNKCYISSIAWTDADAPEALSSLYSSDYKSTMESGASISVSSSSMTETSGGSGWVSAYSKYYKAGSTNREATITFSPALSLVSDGNDRGKIRIYYGSTDKSLNTTVINDFKINGGSSIGTAYGVLEKEKVHVIEYTIPVGTSTLTTIYNKIAVTNGCLLHVEVLTHSAGGGCTSHSVSLSSSGSVTGGTFATSSTTVCEGETATLTATPAAGYEFTSWSATGTGEHSLSSTTTNPATLTMGTADVTVSATFSLIDYTVSKTLTNCAVKAGSSAFPSTLNYGDDFSTIIEPTSGNLLPGSITVSGVSSYTWNALTGALALTDVTGNVSVSITAAAPQTGTSKTITYTMIKTNETTASYSSSTFTNVLSGGASAANTIVASNIMKGGNGVGVQAGKTTANGTYTAGITSSTSAFDAASTPYVQFSFDVVDGYTFTPTGISVPVQPISNNAYFKILVTDGSSTWTTTSSECTAGTKTTITTAPTGGSALSGTVNVKVYCYSQATSAAGYRFATPVTVTGTVATSAVCTAPNHVDISGAWDKFGGETISLTATAYSSAGTGSPIADANITGWQWQKLIGTTWTDVSNGTVGSVVTSGATTKNLQITNCGQGNSGKYRCVVSTGATCSTASATATDGSEGYGVKVYVLECYTGGTTVYNFTRDGENQAGSVTINLSASTAYTFKVHADDYYGNSGTINFDVTNWVCSTSQGNLTVNSGLGGTFTFDVEYSTGGNSSVEGEPELSVTYPRKTVYLKPNSDWKSDNAKFAFYYFHKNGEDTDKDGWTTGFLSASVCDGDVYPASIPQWNGVKIIGVRFNSSEASPGWNGEGHVWNQTDDLVLTSNDLVEITGWSKSQTYTSSYDAPEYTISFDGNGETSGSMTDVEDIECDASVTLEANAFVKTGYTFTGWKDGSSNDYADEATISNITANIALTAKWTAKSYTLTLDKNHSSASAAASSSSVNYDATSFTPTAPTYDGHSVDGYYTSANCTTLVATAAGALQASITVSETVWTNSSSEWKKDGAATFYAHWKCNTPSISCTDNVVTITVPTGSTVYYTTNGSTPTAGSLEYDPSDKPTISANTTINAIAIQSGCTSSDVASEDCTFTGDCEETTLFSMVVKSSINDYSLVASTTVTNSDDAVSSRLTSISGGTLSIENTTKSSNKTVFDNNCLYISSNDVYYTITLSGSKTLQAGDSITITTRTAYSPYITTSSTRAENPTMTKSGSSDPYTYTLTIANTSAATGKNLIGYGTFYLWKNSSAAQIHSIKITRPCVDATHSISYDKGEGTGTMSSHASIAHNGSQELTSNSFTAPDNYTFAGWAADVDVTVGGSTVKAGALIANGATITNITSDIALTAKWKQTITLNANTSNHGSGDNTSAVAILNGTALNSISHTSAASGYKLAGYYTAATEGTKVLNSDGSFASTAVTDYISDSKWTRTGAAPTLYAQYEASGSIKWNLVVNSDTTTLATSTKNSSYTEISTSNMTDAAVNGVTYTHSTKSGLTGKISTPAYDADKYVKVTFQVASGYKFTPSLIQVPIQPVGNNEHKAVELRLTDESSHSLVSASATKCEGTTKGKKTTVTLAGDGSTYFTGTVTLKIYVYPHGEATAATNACYRLGTPIQIDGAVEATCTMPSYESVSYSQTEYIKDASASAISVVGASGDPSYQWKYNSTGDRTSGTECGTEASVTPSTASVGTLYYWCELTGDCATPVKTPAIAITVSALKSTATVTWTDPASKPNYGGGGYTIKATVDQSAWDGTLAASMLTAPEGIRFHDVTISTDGSSRQYIEAQFDVQTSFNTTENPSTIPFTLSLPATTNYNALSDEEGVNYDACTGTGDGASYDLKVRKVTTKDGNYYYWKNTDGWISMNPNNSHSSEKADNAMYGGVFDSIYNTNGQYVYIRTYRANINKVRIYADFRANDMTVSGVYKSTTYFTPGSSNAVDYSVIYNEDEDAENMGTQAQKVVDIILDEAMDVNDIMAVKFSVAKIRPQGAVMTEASAGKLPTTLGWSATVDDDTNKKSVTTADASFTITASPTSSNSNTLGVVTYASNHSEYASVNASTGQVTPIGAGTAQITATLAASGCYESTTATYTVVVTEPECSETAGRVTVADAKTEVCTDDLAVLTLTLPDARTNVQWYNDETEISNGGDYTIAFTSGTTTSTLTTSQSGVYWAKAWTSCTKATAQRSNSITLTSKATEVGATREVSVWYVKNGRKTPGIALWNLDEGTHLNTVTITRDDGNDPAIGLTASDFTELDGVVYLSGKEPSANETGVDVNYTLTLTVENACGSTTIMSDAADKIQLVHQKNTDKHVLAFVVTGTEKGGWTAGISADQTTNVELYNEIAKNFDVLATNIYSTDDEQKLKEYYSQFDILCITDYPNTGTKGVNKKSYVDAIGALVDIRPILTMEAFVSKLDNWKSKGISGTPKSPTTRQYSMLLQCKDHEIFSGTTMTTVGSGDETMYRVNMVDKTQEEYATLDATYGEGVHQKDEGYQYGKKPALQGFTYDASMSSLLPLGRIDDGSGSDLQVGVERQAKMEARLLVLGINSYAMERLEDDGVTIVINTLKYLMKKNAENIADCSNYFVGGAETGSTSDWFNTENWSNRTLPDKTQEVRIVAPCTIGGNKIARAASVKIITDGKYNYGSSEASGSLVIAKDGALVVDGKIQMAKAPYYNEVVPTTSDKLRVESYSYPSSKQGALIFDNTDHQNEATVEMYTQSHWKDVEGVRKKYWSYVAVPIEEVQVPYYFWNGYTYIFDEQRGWIRKGDWSYIHPFEGVGLSTETGGYDWFFGRLASTESLDVTLTKTVGKGNGDNLIGNSWTAPIQIANFESSDFVNANASIYIFNTGSWEDAAESADPYVATAENDGAATAGQWLAIPIGVAGDPDYSGLKVIPAMQGYKVVATGTGSLHLDYDRLVRGKGKGGLGSGSQLNEPIRAPKRNASGIRASESMLRVRVTGTKTHTDVWMLQDDRFTYDFDNGWEAKYVACDDRSARLYAVSDLGNMAFLAQPEIDGTFLGFKPAYGCTEYTFSFHYRGDEKLYLNDLLTETSTLITNESTYTFSSEQEINGNRFLITSQPYGITGVTTNLNDANVESRSDKPMKFIYNDKMYILYRGMIFDANGKLINRK